MAFVAGADVVTLVEVVIDGVGTVLFVMLSMVIVVVAPAGLSDRGRIRVVGDAAGAELSQTP